MTASSLDFAELVRWTGQHARTLGLAVPGYRSPPSHPTANRSARRHDDGRYTICVRVRGRTELDIALGVVAGVALANDIGEGHPDMMRLRTLVIEAAGLGAERKAVG